MFASKKILTKIIKENRNEKLKPFFIFLKKRKRNIKSINIIFTFSTEFPSIIYIGIKKHKIFIKNISLDLLKYESFSINYIYS